MLHCIRGATDSLATGDTENLVNEVADLMFHTLVLVAASGLNLGLLWDELSSSCRLTRSLLDFPSGS